MNFRDNQHKYRDHDYLETKEGWIFCVVSDLHPPDRVCAFLKYIHGEGEWIRGGERYSRIVKLYKTNEIKDTLDFLRMRRPEYLHYEPTVGEAFSYIPVNSIKQHYKCEERAREILSSPSNPLEHIVAELIEEIEGITGISSSYMGITGSILVGLQNPRADIDLIIYGRDNFWRAAEAVEHIAGREAMQGIRLGFMKSLMSKYPLTQAEASKLSERLTNRGVYRDKVFSIHAVKLLDEIDAKYGEVIYKPVGFSKVLLKIREDRYSCFTPAVYHVEQLSQPEVASGDELEIRTLTCYDTSFACLMRRGDVVECCGKIEEVMVRKTVERYLNILVGAVSHSEGQYVKLLE